MSSVVVQKIYEVIAQQIEQMSEFSKKNLYIFYGTNSLKPA